MQPRGAIWYIGLGCLPYHSVSQSLLYAFHPTSASWCIGLGCLLFCIVSSAASTCPKACCTPSIRLHLSLPRCLVHSQHMSQSLLYDFHPISSCGLVYRTRLSLPPSTATTCPKACCTPSIPFRAAAWCVGLGRLTSSTVRSSPKACCTFSILFRAAV